MISIIVAVDEKRGIGKDNTLPWHIPEDLKRFKNLTSGHPIIMGRKTFESIGKPLPNRTNIIITRDANYSSMGTFVTHSLEDALHLAQGAPGSEEIFVIGGGQIFQQALPIVGRIYLTLVKGIFPADVFFPDYSGFAKVISSEQSQDQACTFLTLER